MSIEEITRSRSYLAYQHSGIPWLKDIPAHWTVPRLKTQFVLNDSGVWSEESDDRGTIVLRSTEQTVDGHWNIKNPARLRIGDRERDVATLVTGDLVITKSSGSNAHIGKTTLVDAEVSSLRACFSNFMQRVRTGDGIKPRLLWYYFNNYIGREQLLAAATTTTGLANLNGRIIGNARIPMPPLDEQAAIVRYLDDAEQRIRAYVSVKERLIALLEEERQAVIHQAVTRGLAPNVKLKPSGVEWLGDVPEHWDVDRLKSNVANINDATRERRGDEPYIALEQVESWTGKTQYAGEETSFDSQVKRFQAGDVLFGKLRPYLAKVTTPAKNGVCVGEFLVLRANDTRMATGYLERVLRSRRVIDTIDASTFGAKMPRADWEFIGNLKQPVPPLNEQAAIVNHLREVTSDIDSVINRARRQIELMEEYRTRLIADVVTGKLDVR